VDSTLLALTGPDGRFIGSVSTVRERLQILVDHTGANELIVTTRIPAHTDRLQPWSPKRRELELDDLDAVEDRGVAGSNGNCPASGWLGWRTCATTQPAARG
jgi:hypothetical protein